MDPRAVQLLLARPVTVAVDRVSMKRALQAIAANAHIDVQYQAEVLAAAPANITLRVTKVPLETALRMLFAGTSLHAIPLGEDRVAVVGGPGAEGVEVSSTIQGTVNDARTKRPVVGALVTLDDARRGVTTGDDGTFRMTGVTTGAHVLHVRKLQYARHTESITAVDGDVVLVNVKLEPSVNALEQVVVTGTVVATELKAVPNAITVITGKELEQRGITRIYEFFRGDVPGLYMNRTGQAAASNPGASGVYARGGTNLGNGQEGIKTYVDGVEIANRDYLGLIDPTSIERIEILTGPQASTIYGSNAINGVMQIFTKRGTSVRPQVLAAVKSTWTQNSFSSGLAPNHHADATVSGLEGQLSYNVGGSWMYEGSWVPGVLGQTLSGFGGGRISRRKWTADASLSVLQGRNQADGGVQQVEDIFNSDGTDSYGGVVPTHLYRANTDRLSSLSGTYTMTPWWSHTVQVGLDYLTTVSQLTQKTYGLPQDTGFSLGKETMTHFTAAYNTTVQIWLTSMARATVTVGADESHSADQDLYGNYIPASGTSGTYTSTDDGGWQYRQTRAHEHGGFLQSQFGVWDALFFTYGLRAVYNPNIGRDQNPNVEPRYGIAYTHDVAGLTAKVRASYGTATRPPRIGAKDERKGPAYVDLIRHQLFGTNVTQLANPDLVPESQQGGEGGLDLYFGNRGSIETTHYNQTVNDLIVAPTVDSVDRLPSWKSANPSSRCAQAWECPLRQTQNLNIGSVRNLGWEMKGTLNISAFTATGTYSWTKSRLIGITPRYRSQFPYFFVGAPLFTFAEHTYAIGLTYARGGTRIGYNLQGQGRVPLSSYDTFLYRLGTNLRLQSTNAPRVDVPDTYTEIVPGFALGDLNVSQQMTPWLEGLLEIHNVTNSFQADINPVYAQSGRVTGVGFRFRF